MKGFERWGAHQLIGARLADARLANILRTTVGTPLVHVRLQVLDLASRPIELLSAHYRTESYVHHVFLAAGPARPAERSEEHTSELQSLMPTSYAVLCVKKTKLAIQTTERHVHMAH